MKTRATIHAHFGTSGKGAFAFTLVEVLFALFIVFFLIAIVVPMAGYAQRKAREVKCVANLRQYAVATQSFVSDNDGLLPQTAWDSSGHYAHYDLAPYLLPATDNSLRITLLSCPESQPDNKWIYGFNSAISKTEIANYTRPSSQILATCCGQGWLDINTISGKNQHLKKTPKPHSGKISVLRLDGGVTLEYVSTLTYAEVRRDTKYASSSDERTYFLDGDAQYDQ